MPQTIKKETFALVTGGSSGIGLAFVHQLAERGYNICIVSNQEGELPLLEKEITEKYSVKCVSLFIDLSQDNAVQEVYNFCQVNLLTIEVLIYCAGILIAEEFINITPQQISTLLKLHILTTTLLCQLFAIDMVARKKGFILTISSTSASMPYPIISIYGPSKSYIRNFTKAIRNELYSKNINVCCVLPGAVDTNLFALDAPKKKLAKRLGIMATPEYIAKRSLRALFRNKGELVPGFLNKLSLVFIKAIPGFVLRSLLRRWNRAKVKKIPT